MAADAVLADIIREPPLSIINVSDFALPQGDASLADARHANATHYHGVARGTP
jgi:hypothetical protein